MRFMPMRPQINPQIIRRMFARFPKHWRGMLSCVMLAGLHVPVANADMRWYQVEVLVFAHQHSTASASTYPESAFTWPSFLEGMTAPARPLAELRQAMQAYAPVRSEDRLLQAAEQSLQLQGLYQPLAHLSWLQALDDGQVGGAVHVHVDDPSGQGKILDGYVQVGQEGQTYLQADLAYAASGVTGSGAGFYRLQEKRSLPVGEPHYFDHPQFGMIARIEAVP